MIKRDRHPLILAVSLVTVLSACAVGSGTEIEETQRRGPGATVDPTIDAAGASCPMRVVLLPDKTKSAVTMRTPQLSWEDLQPLIARLLESGGELAIGTLDDSSNSPLVRVRVDEPPVAPTPAAEADNVWKRAEDRRDHSRALETYNAEHQTWKETASRKIAWLRVQADSLLGADPDAGRTDVWGAVSRAAYFLEEPGIWRCEPQEAAILITDAVDNVGSSSVPWPSGAGLYLVNGTPSLGALEDLDPLRFESIEAAVRFVLEAHAR